MAPAETPLIEARGIAKSFGGVDVLHGVDLDLAGGEVTRCSVRTAPASRPSPT